MKAVPYSDKSCHVPGWARRAVEVLSPGCGAGGVALCLRAPRSTATHRRRTINSSSGAHPDTKPNTSSGGGTRVSGVNCDWRENKAVTISKKCEPLRQSVSVTHDSFSRSKTAVCLDYFTPLWTPVNTTIGKDNPNMCLFFDVYKLMWRKVFWVIWCHFGVWWEVFTCGENGMWQQPCKGGGGWSPG